MQDPAKAIADVLEACIRGDRLLPETLSELEKRSDLPAGLVPVVHELHHFVDDEDLWSGDPEYARYWRERLGELLTALVASHHAKP